MNFIKVQLRKYYSSLNEPNIETRVGIDLAKIAAQTSKPVTQFSTICSALNWAKSNEGYDYWHARDVYINTKDIEYLGDRPDSAYNKRLSMKGVISSLEKIQEDLRDGSMYLESIADSICDEIATLTAIRDSIT